MPENTSNYLKKLGKRKANTHGRCGSKKEKRLASKGVRKAELIEQLGYDPDRDPMQDYWDSESDKIAIAQEELVHETS